MAEIFSRKWDGNWDEFGALAVQPGEDPAEVLERLWKGGALTSEQYYGNAEAEWTGDGIMTVWTFGFPAYKIYVGFDVEEEPEEEGEFPWIHYRDSELVFRVIPALREELQRLYEEEEGNSYAQDCARAELREAREELERRRRNV